MSLDAALVEVPVSPADSESSRTLTVLPSGPMPPNPPELLESDAMRELMDELTQRFDLVVIDTPALGILSDALTVAPLATEIIAVGGLVKTTRDGARKFIQQLALTKKQPIGLIVTLTDFNKNQYSYYRRSASLFRG
jgi:Mrp family chromosome partitioning ATPase